MVAAHHRAVQGADALADCRGTELTDTLVAMSGSGHDEPELPGGYIRGGAGVPTDTRQVLRVVVWAILASLAILTIAMVVNGLHHNARAQRLQHHGVAVAVTVTSCLGQATGLPLSYQLDAVPAAGVVTAGTRVVIFTITGGV